MLSEQLNYTYKAEEIGEFTLLFCATDNKTNVTFTKEISVDVIASWKYGWMVLSRSAGNESQLSMILSKKQKISVTVDGKDVSRDTVVYVGENMNMYQIWVEVLVVWLKISFSRQYMGCWLKMRLWCCRRVDRWSWMEIN